MILNQDALIRERAYAIWESQGRPEGRDKENWDQAARELANSIAAPEPAKRKAVRSAAPTVAAAKKKTSPAVATPRKKK
jgi:hypothetical protein